MQKLISFVPAGSKEKKEKKVEFKPFIQPQKIEERNVKIEGKRKQLWD